MSVPPGSSTTSEGRPAEQPGCFRHPDRPTGLRCTRCERPACPDCLREASVGYHCLDCVSEGQRGMRRQRTIAGAALSNTAIVVPALIVANVLLYLATAIQAGSGTQNNASALFDVLSLSPLTVASGQWWSLITSGFLHMGLAHLAMNMIALWVIGRDLELLLGRVRFASVYALSLLGGSTAVFLFGDMGTPVAGASGAVYGLIGGIAVAAFRLKVSLRPVLTVIAINIALTLFIPGLSLLGHLGGLIAGAIATAALVYAPRARQVRWQAGALLGLLCLLVVMLVTRDAQLGDVTCFSVGGRTDCLIGAL